MVAINEKQSAQAEKTVCAADNIDRRCLERFCGGEGWERAWLPRDLRDSVTPWCPTFTEISLWLNCALRSACEMHRDGIAKAVVVSRYSAVSFSDQDPRLPEMVRHLNSSHRKS
jgi:hypothetical protein